MTDFDQLYTLWDEFLTAWPHERLATMTLDEYTSVGSKNSFTYWIESRLDKIGSIWGGSSFKFGVFSRSNTEEKKSDTKLSYSDTHGWYSSLGSTVEEAFDNVRSYVVQVANMAAQGDLDGIEAFQNLGEAFKWKIAFHYQNRESPSIVGIFKRAPLAAFVGGTASQSMATLQKLALGRLSEGLGIIEFGHQIWESWSQKNLSIWKVSHGNPPNFTEAERQQYLDEHLAVVHSKTGKDQGQKFVNAPVGTLFFLCHGNSPQRIGQFVSDVAPSAKGDEWVQRSYRVLKSALRTDRYTTNSKNWSPQGNSTFWQVGENDLPEFESTLLKPYFGMDLAELAALAGEPIDSASLTHASARFVREPSPASLPGNKQVATCTNRIYYGPPGTGKTYALQQLLEHDFTDSEDTQSEQAFLIEKVQPLNWFEVITLVMLDRGHPMKVGEIVEHKFYQAKALANGRGGNLRATAWACLQTYTIAGSKIVNYARRGVPAVFDKREDSAWYIVESEREHLAEFDETLQTLRAGPQRSRVVRRYEFVTFHQSYGYEEFMEGLRPVIDEDSDEQVRYEISKGIFVRLCERARDEPEKSFAMVIDEINRGNISKIFGEIITLIEADKREGMPGEITVKLPYSKRPFSVPRNVDLIGSMNTADRSLALVDTALRRRFDFVELAPDPTILAGLSVSADNVTIDIAKLLATINRRIEVLYDRDHTIGHAYFTPLANAEDKFKALGEIFAQKIIPLLEEYFFEDWRKIRLVLGDHRKPEENQFIREIAMDSVLEELFGNEYDLEQEGVQRQFVRNPAAIAIPQAYIGVYQSN